MMSGFKYIEPEENHVCHSIQPRQEVKKMTQGLKTKLLLLGLTKINNARSKPFVKRLVNKVKK